MGTISAFFVTILGLIADNMSDRAYYAGARFFGMED